MALSNLSFSILRLRNFRFFLLTRFFVTMALQSQAVIVGWQVYSITKNPFLLGLTGLVEAVPAIAGAFFAGHVVDNSHPQRAYILTIGALALNIIGMFIVGGGYTDAAPDGIVAFLFISVFISGLARSFLMPSAFSLLARVVSRADLPAATAWISSVVQTAFVVGPAVAGLVYGGYGAHGAWLLPTILISLALLTVSLLKIEHAPRTEKREAAWKSIRAGWAFIWNTPLLLAVMALDMFAVLFGGAVAMLPAYADQILHVGSEGLGALRAAPALGAVTTALILAIRPMRHMTATRLFWAVAGFGACIIGFGLSETFWISMVFLIVSGIFDSVSMLMRGTLMQLLTPDNMRGRVSSISSMFIISSNEIGAFESGAAAQLMGLVPSVVFGGVMSIVVVGATALFAPKLRKTVIDTRTHSL